MLNVHKEYQFNCTFEYKKAIMKYQSVKSPILKYILIIFWLIILTPLIISSVYHWHGYVNFFTGLFVTALLITLSIVFSSNNYYIIKNNSLIIKYRLLTKIIPIDQITKIKLNQKSTSAIIPRASLSFNGIIVCYNREMIFISPVNENDFIQNLKSINPGIAVS